MAHKSLSIFGSGRPGPTQKVWDIAYENMGIGHNSSFLGRKKQTIEERSWRGCDYGSLGHIGWPG